MALFKTKKSNKGKIVATVVGGAVAAGVTYLATTKKGKAMVADAKDGVTSMLKSAEKKEKKFVKKAQKTIAKARTAISKARVAAPKRTIKRTLRSK